MSPIGPIRVRPSVFHHQYSPTRSLPFRRKGVCTDWAMEFARWRFRQNRPNWLMTPTKLKDLAR